MKLLIITFSLMVIIGFRQSGVDYTQTVVNNQRLAAVFEGKDVSNPNHFQVMLIQLCNALKSCGDN